MLLHGYWRSTASYRVRIALGLKGLPYVQRNHDLRSGEQESHAYRAVNPQGLVPAIESDGLVISQSSAIIEWLEETHPLPPLLPPDPGDRAIVRSMAGLIACDIHPLNNLRVLKRLRQIAPSSPETPQEWIGHWISEGFVALESQIRRYGGDFAFGDEPGLVDCFLLPQLYSAQRFGIDTDSYPSIRAVSDRFASIDTVVAAHPSRQPDADPA